MINEILAKLPETLRDRLESEAHSGYGFACCFNYICGVLAASRDFGVISFYEYEILRDHYIAILKGGNA